MPFGGVELDALQVHPVGVAAELFEPGLLVARVVGVVVGQFAGGVLGDEGECFVGSPESVVVEVAEQRGLEDRVVDVSVHEDVTLEAFAAVVRVGVVVPHDLFGGAEVLVIVVEAVDELLAVYVLLVRLAGVPDVHVAVHDEVFLTVLLIHRVLAWSCFSDGLGVSGATLCGPPGLLRSTAL